MSKLNEREKISQALLSEWRKHPGIDGPGEPRLEGLSRVVSEMIRSELESMAQKAEKWGWAWHLPTVKVVAEEIRQRAKAFHVNVVDDKRGG